jgi:hypothetical protein
MSPEWVGDVRLTSEAEGRCERTRFGEITHTFAEGPRPDQRVQCACGGAQLRLDDQGRVVFENMTADTP